MQFTPDMPNMLFQVFKKKEEEKPQDHEQTHFSLIPVNKSLAEN